jgi:ABC-type antimicrobial peptide transport system permease subunit
MNLSTARSEKRAKEVGVRKAIGAQKNSLMLQFIGESVLLSVLAGILAILIVQLSLTGFNKLVNKQLFIDFTNWHYWLFAIGFFLFTGLLAGSYPAFCLAAYQPVKVLKGTFKAEHALVTPRKVLVVLQFTFAIALIICTVIVHRQIQFAQARDVGYTRNNLLYTFLQGETEKHYDAIKAEVIDKGAAVAVTKSMSPITQRYSDGWGFTWPGSVAEDEKVDFIRMASDADFVKTMDVKLLEGRDIDIRKYPSDSSAMLVNETAVKMMRLKEPVGTVINGDGREWRIVGVIKDFIFESPYEKVTQLMVMGPKSFFNVIHIKLNPAKSTAENIAILEQVFRKYNPQYPFEYSFVDEEYATKFEDEKRIGKLAALFAGLTIFISCLGLFALATYMAENRIKEIGIRKSLGASLTGITVLLSKDFLKLVIISFVIASPIAWWSMHNWLQGYTYRILIEWWVFAIAGLVSVIIAIGTVSYQAIKAAMANPVKSLKAE